MPSNQMVTRLLVAVFGGASITIVVAWVCVLLPIKLTCSATLVSARNPPAWCAWIWHGPAVRSVGSMLVTDVAFLDAQARGHGVQIGLRPGVPTWSRPARIDAARAARGDVPPPDAWEFLTEVVSGWPWPALRAAYGAPHGSKSLPTFERGIFIPVLCTHFGQELERGVLPTAPIWPGFLGNTAVYALVIFPIISARHWRRQHRVRRGLCAKCAYPVSGMEKCPECGTSVSKGTVVATRA